MNEMNEKWSVCNKTGDFNFIMNTFGVTASTARLLINRGKVTEKDIREFLYPEPDMLFRPELMRNLVGAADVIDKKLSSGGLKFRVIGDYDADGIMSTYILSDMFKRLGAEADFYIPDRIKDGYGINEDMIRKAHEDGIDTIITCDNGISAVSAAELSKKLGITLIITDHHELPNVLPDADIIIDPKHPMDTYPCKDICGAVVAAKLASFLLERHNIVKNGEGCLDYLEFMAIATLCDVVPMAGENRTIAVLGLRKLNACYKGKERVFNTGDKTVNHGLKALIELCEIKGDINDYTVGFILGPCLNATGRLDLAGRAMNMLQAVSDTEAKEYAGECIRLNEERKRLTLEWTERAFEILDSSENIDKVIVAELPECHESLAGIIAGRIREKYLRPSFVLTNGKDGMKGSGRSIPGYNMFEELQKCSDLFSKFGGHPMAAGLSLMTDNAAMFRERININCNLCEEDFKKKVLLDAVVPLSSFDEKSVEELKLFMPFGSGNPSPVFGDRNNKVIRMKRMGKNNNFLKFILEDSKNRKFEAICFKNADDIIRMFKEKYGESQVDAAFSGKYNDISVMVSYTPEINEYNGNRSIQMKISGLLPGKL